MHCDFLATPRERTALLPRRTFASGSRTNLRDFVLGVLKSTFGDKWWVEGVPQNIRKENAARQQEDDEQFPKEAYFDIIDFKPIMEKKWTLFESHFASAGKTGGKKMVLAFMDPLNNLRRLVGHPLKMHVSGYKFSRDEQQLLSEVDSMVLRLCANFTNTTAPKRPASEPI